MTGSSTSLFLFLPPSSFPAPLPSYLVHALHVLTQATRRGEAGGAHLASERLLPRVHPLMGQMGNLTLEPFLAMSALELRIGVNLLVVLKLGHVAKALSALLAQELLLCGVDNVLVLPPQSQRLERLRALGTGVHHVLVLRAPVLLQALLGRELLATLVAVMKEVGQSFVVLLFGSLGGSSIGLIIAQKLTRVLRVKLKKFRHHVYKLRPAYKVH